MQSTVFDIEVDEKVLIVWQLRILCPKINWNDLEKIYYVWKYPNYKEKWIEFGMTPNMHSSYSLEQRLEEKGVIITKGKILDENGKKRKVKGLLDSLIAALSTQSVSLTINLIQKK